MTRTGGEAPESYPTDAPMGPMVALDERVRRLRRRHLQPLLQALRSRALVGKRTWGGVVGIWPRHALVDGTLTTQPEFAFWFKDVGWGVENHGTDPDIEVEIPPQDHAAGRDPQMDRGIEEIQKLLRKHPAKRPEFKNRPRLAAGRLPAAR